MKALKNFVLQISNLNQGINEFEFDIDDTFFRHFEHSPVKEGKVKLNLSIDRRTSVMDLRFHFEGDLKTACDRCLESFFFPINESAELVVKFVETEGESEDIDVVFVKKGETEFDISNYVYEFVLLTLPISKYHEDADEVCDDKIMEILNRQASRPQDKPNNPFGDALKNFNKN